MWWNYVIIALRNLLRQKGYATLNIFALSVGIAFGILTIMYVQHELSYDTFHADADHIYRVYHQEQAGDEKQTSGLMPTPFAPAVLETFPEVTNTVKIRHQPGFTIRYREKAFNL